MSCGTLSPSRPFSFKVTRHAPSDFPTDVLVCACVAAWLEISDAINWGPHQVASLHYSPLYLCACMLPSFPFCEKSWQLFCVFLVGPRRTFCKLCSLTFDPSAVELPSQPEPASAVPELSQGMLPSNCVDHEALGWGLWHVAVTWEESPCHHQCSHRSRTSLFYGRNRKIASSSLSWDFPLWRSA